FSSDSSGRRPGFRRLRAWRAASWSGSRLRPLLSEESATPYLVVPREGGVQAFVYLRRLSGWISLRLRTRGSVRRGTLVETRRRGDKRASARVSLHTA